MREKRKPEAKGDFGLHLKGLILKAGYPSVEKFALENGFDRVTIYRIVEKAADPRLSMVRRLISALEVSANELIKP